jgi:septum formation protein
VSSPPLLVLASSSAYRRELLGRLKLPFVSAAPDIDEAPLAGEFATSTALRLSRAKARAVATRYPEGLIIGSDQVAVLDGEHIGKPGNHEAALAQLTAISGRLVAFHTAVCLYDARSGACDVAEVTTRVQLRSYSAAQANRYLEAEPAYDCAGSARIESLGIALAERIESPDPTALIGLPLIALVTMLKRAGIEVP